MPKPSEKALQGVLGSTAVERSHSLEGDHGATTFGTDNLGDPILVLDGRETVVHANEAALRFFAGTAFGRQLEESYSNSAPLVPDPESDTASSALHAMIREALGGGTVRGRTLSVECRCDGRLERRQGVCRAHAITLDGSRGAILSLHDISRQALLPLLPKECEERECEEHHSGPVLLDHLVHRGQLAAGVAHEINNPLMCLLHNIEQLKEVLPRLAASVRRCSGALTVVVGPEVIAELLGDDRELLQQEGFDRLQTRLQDAALAANHIKTITRHLSSAYRADPVDLVGVDVHKPLEHAIGIATSEFRSKARLVRDYSPVPPVLASDGKLVQVFLNLLVNSAHAIAEDKVPENEIRVRTYAEDKWVCVAVSDTGHGIANELKSRIFEPFFTTKASGLGLGLGLSICKSIVTSLGGEIDFESALGSGSCFRVRLPRLSPLLPEPEPPDDPRPKGL